jgi:putative oxidoreductase
LILRLVIGVVMFGHGAQKLFGWFGGYGLAGTSGFFASQFRLRPARLWTLVAGLSEAGGGLLLLLGFFNPLGPIAIVASMIVAAALAHWPRFWAHEGGIEYPLVLIAASLAAALAGPGSWSLDAALGVSLAMPEALLVGLAMAVLGALVTLATREPTKANSTSELPRAA